MIKRFPTLRFLPLAILAGFAFSSCSDDDEEDTSNLNNQVAYNGTNYMMKSGMIVDYGMDNTHYNFDFFTSDGTITFGSDDLHITNGKIAIYAELLSVGTSEFKAGTFTKVDDDDDPAHANKYIYEDAFVIVDSNNDNMLDEDDAELDVSGGTVTVSGSNRNYKIEYDLTLDNGRTVKGSYSGAFSYVDER